ncbi:MAG: histidine triad nucleotide-binding protein [Clostridia bacterium]|nr:histidine triad nucleotide-binding protein [Clostridia bacterium]MBQ3496307.1 histidine triad nucleotide-binding protein [Clostridia bacterium]
MSDCLFCKFVSGEFATTKVFENDDFIIIRDINPQAANHFLAIPKKHYKLLADMTEEDSLTLGRILKTIPTLEDLLGLNGGYRLVINQGDDAGQTVHHLHIHILSGQKMGWNPAG